MTTRHEGATRSTVKRLVSSWCLLFCVLIVHATVARSAAAPADDVFRWHGEVVRQDLRTLTVKSRIVSQAALAETEAVREGDPIIITWSGFGDRANGIRFVQPVQPPPDRFQLQAEFLGLDPHGSYVTFRVALSERARAATRVLRQGEWVTGTSLHAAPAARAGAAGAVRGIRRFTSADRGDTAHTDGTYDWSAEFVSRDDKARTVTLKSRIVSREATRGLRGLTYGEPILVTWSGLDNHAHGIRSVRRDHARIETRFRLSAEFVAVDVETRYLTFRIQRPADRPEQILSVRSGRWATLTASRRALDGAATVVSVRPFEPVGGLDVADGSPHAGPTGNYRWHAELVGLDEQAGVLTVRAPVVSREGLTEIGGLRAGVPIVVTWSGVEKLAHGIRRVDLVSQGQERAGFTLAAEFVAVAPETRYVTFAVTVGVESLVAVRALDSGDWVTVTSPHRATGEAIVGVEAYDSSRRLRADIQAGQFRSVDRDNTVVALAAPVAPRTTAILGHGHVGPVGLGAAEANQQGPRRSPPSR